jgi:hypothetical protein
MKFVFNYKIIKIDIATGSILVKYTPVDNNLTSITLNIPVIFDDDDVPLSIEKNIELYAPQLQWASQLHVKDNYDSLINKTGTITPE